MHDNDDDDHDDDDSCDEDHDEDDSCDDDDKDIPDQIYQVSVSLSSLSILSS
jgi:hypothetical protein